MFVKFPIFSHSKRLATGLKFLSDDLIMRCNNKLKFPALSKKLSWKTFRTTSYQKVMFLGKNVVFARTIRFMNKLLIKNCSIGSHNNRL